MKKIVCVLLALIMCFAFVSCGGDSSSSESTGEVSDSEPTKAIGSGSPEEIVGEYYQFEVDGHEYGLPCALKEFTDNGWYIREEELNTDLDANTRTTVFVYSDAEAEDKAFTLDVINMTDSTKKISETNAIGLSVGSSSTACKSITMKKAGVLIDVSNSDAAKETAEKLKKAYGTTEEVGYADNSDAENISFSWNFSSLIPDDQKSEGYIMGINESTKVAGVAEKAEDYIDGVEFSIEYADILQ